MVTLRVQRDHQVVAFDLDSDAVGQAESNGAEGAASAIGIGTRGAFYEKTGVVRDMIQNHLLQLLCMTAMEPPVAYKRWKPA